MEWSIAWRVLLSTTLYGSWHLIAAWAELPVYVTTFAFVIGFGTVATGYGVWNVYPQVPMALVMGIIFALLAAVCMLTFMRSQVAMDNAWTKLAVAVFAGSLNGIATVSLSYIAQSSSAGTAIGLMNMGTVPVTVLCAALFFNKGQLDYRTWLMMFFACLAVASPLYLPARSSAPITVKP